MPGLGWFTLNRDFGGPAYNWEHKRTTAYFRYNAWFTGILCMLGCVLAILALILPTLRAKAQTTILVTISFGILTTMLLGCFTQEWQVGTVNIKTALRITDKHTHDMQLGLHIGLKSLNITLISITDHDRGLTSDVDYHANIIEESVDFVDFELHVVNEGQNLYRNRFKHKDVDDNGSGSRLDDTTDSHGRRMVSDGDFRANIGESYTVEEDLNLYRNSIKHKDADEIGSGSGFDETMFLPLTDEWTDKEENLLERLRSKKCELKQFYEEYMKQSNGSGELPEKQIEFLKDLGMILKAVFFPYGYVSESFNEPLTIKDHSDQEYICMNEEFSLDKLFLEHYQESHRIGLPSAIMTVLDYMCVRAPRRDWVTNFRQGGTAAASLVYAAFVCWSLMFIFFLTIPTYGPAALTVLGMLLISAVTFYDLTQTSLPLVIYTEGNFLQLSYGLSFHLIAWTGFASILLGVVGMVIAETHPHLLSSDLEISPSSNELRSKITNTKAFKWSFTEESHNDIVTYKWTKIPLPEGVNQSQSSGDDESETCLNVSCESIVEAIVEVPLTSTPDASLNESYESCNIKYTTEDDQTECIEMLDVSTSSTRMLLPVPAPVKEIENRQGKPEMRMTYKTLWYINQGYDAESACEASERSQALNRNWQRLR